MLFLIVCDSKSEGFTAIEVLLGLSFLLINGLLFFGFSFRVSTIAIVQLDQVVFMPAKKAI